MSQLSRHKHNAVASYSAQYSKSFVERWDDLIDWEKRKAGENGFFEDLLKGHGVKSVIDVSTGSGFHAVQLKRAGLDVVATDGSSTMLTKARANFRMHGLQIQSHYRDWLSLDPQELGQFDAVVCLGSSLCHVFEAQARRNVLEKFRALLCWVACWLSTNATSSPYGPVNSNPAVITIIAARMSVSLGEVHADLCEFIYSFDNAEEYRLQVYPLLPGELKTEVLASGFRSIAVTVIFSLTTT